MLNDRRYQAPWTALDWMIFIAALFAIGSLLLATMGCAGDAFETDAPGAAGASLTADESECFTLASLACVSAPACQACDFTIRCSGANAVSPGKVAACRDAIQAQDDDMRCVNDRVQWPLACLAAWQ